MLYISKCTITNIKNNNKNEKNNEDLPLKITDVKTTNEKKNLNFQNINHTSSHSLQQFINTASNYSNNNNNNSLNYNHIQNQYEHIYPHKHIMNDQNNFLNEVIHVFICIGQIPNTCIVKHPCFQ